MSAITTGRCGFCNDVFLDKANIICEKCGMIHHEQCWEAIGGVCARHGCGSVPVRTSVNLRPISSVKDVVKLRHSGILQVSCCAVLSVCFYCALTLVCGVNENLSNWLSVFAYFISCLFLFIKTGERYY